MSGIHSRMPVILSKDGEDTWLDPGSRREALVGLLRPPDQGLAEHESSQEVNSPANNLPGLIEPFAKEPGQARPEV